MKRDRPCARVDTIRIPRAIRTLLAMILTMPCWAEAAELALSDDSLVNVGSYVYRQHCVSCHGEDGRGGQAVGTRETVPAPDLSKLARRNGGEFPFWELYETISGNELLPAHGSRLMPIWGQELRTDAGGGGTDGATLARGRILALMAYLATLQDDVNTP